MFHRCVAMVPLLAALAVAQTDRRVIYAEPGFIAEAYGLDLLGSGAMTSRLDITSSGAGTYLYCLLPDPTPACHQTLLIAENETRLPLGSLLGMNGWLLVDPVFGWVTVPLRDPIVIPRGHHLCGYDFFFQSVTVRPNDLGGFDFSLSHGLKLTFYHT